MKKLLAVLLAGCVSVSLVGMGNEPAIQNGYLRGGRGNNGQRRHENNNGQQGDHPFRGTRFINPSFNFLMLPQEQDKGYGQRIIEKTENYIIDGIAQQLARPIVEVASIPIILAENFIASLFFKEQREHIELQNVRNKFTESLSTTADTLFNNIKKQNILSDQLKTMIEESGLDVVELKKIEQELQESMLEFHKELALNFQERVKTGSLNPEEKTLWNMLSIKQQQINNSDDHEKLYELNVWLQEELVLNFTKRLQNNTASQREKDLQQKIEDKQKELSQRAKSFTEDDMNLVAAYNQSRKSQRDNIYEALHLIENQNRISKETFNHVQQISTAQEKELVRVIQQRQLKKQQEHIEKENKVRARELKKQQEHEEHALEKSNEEFLFKQRHGIK